MIPSLLLAFVMPAQLGPAPQDGGSVAVIKLREAITRTREGQARLQELQAASSKRQKAIEQRQLELNSLRSRLSSSANILSGPAQNDLLREIEQKTRELQREIDDMQWEAGIEERRIVEEIGRPMMKLIVDYAQEHGYVLVLDVSSPGANVVWAATAVDITDAIARIYDESHLSSAKPQSSRRSLGP